MKRRLALVAAIPLFLKNSAAASANQSCSVCTNFQSSDTNNNNDTTTTATKTDLAFPNAIIPVHHENGELHNNNTSAIITCQDLNDQLGLLVPSINTTDELTECEAWVAKESTMIDLVGYCGCHEENNATDVTAISIHNSGCSFCSMENIADENLVVDFNYKNGSDDTTQQWTCGNLAGLAPFITDTSLCQEVQDFMPTCCDAAPGDNNDTDVSPQSLMTCTLCGATARAPSPDGRSYSAVGSLMVMGFLNRSIPVAGTGRSANQLQSCQEINEILGQDPLIVNEGDDNGSQACTDKRNAWMDDQDIHLDLPSYCGCPGSSAPRICEFSCAYSSEEYVINEELVADKLQDGTKLTCGDILSAIPYIVDFDVCLDYQKYQSLCCSNFEASCHLCQAAAPATTSLSTTTAPKMEHSEKIIPSLQRTCGLVNQYFGTVLSLNDNNVTEECNNYRSAESQKAIVDLESYCGCETAVAPNTCSFCAVENMTNPNFVLRDILSGGSHHQRHRGAIDKLNDWGIAGNSMTCRAVAELVPIVTNDTFCDDLQYFAPICCPDVQPTCTLCSSVAENGPTLTKPDAIVPGRKETCAEVDRYFHLVQGGATACNAQRNGFVTDMDLVAYCGCPGQEAPKQCNFCDSADLIDPEIVIGIGKEARTCGYLAEIAPYITNQTLCDWLEFAEPQCCQPKLESSPCSLCENQGQMGRPNSVVEHQKGTTCQALDQTIQQLPRDICTQVKGDWDFDLESFCGCEGSRVMDRCELCGPGQVLRNHSAALPDRASWTCDMGQQQAPFVNSKVVCNAQINTDANKEVCCEPVKDTPTTDNDDSGQSIEKATDEARLSETLLWMATFAEILAVLVLLLLRRRELTTVQSTPVNLAPASIPETAALI